jgi:subtilisin family serine protease
MQQSPEYGQGKGAELLRPIDDLLENPLDPVAFPNLVEDYHKLAAKDIHLAELYRLTATSQGDRLILDPVQTVRIDGKLWVDVMAEINEKASIKELQQIMQLHHYTRRFISGRILIQRLPELNELVVGMQTSRPIRPTLDDSVPDIRADHASLTQHFDTSGNKPLPTGKNVIIGIVDFGCDFLHPNFQDAQKNTRILYFWDQKGAPQTPGLPYGREYDQNFINQAIHDKSSYKDLGLSLENNAHGTHVMDIAAGNSSKYPGVAPEADLVFVQLSLPDPIEAEEEFLGSSSHLYDAVKYIFDKAVEKGKPAVVNISLASNGGPHDGSSMIESMFDDLLTGLTGRAIVMAAGNSYSQGIHASGSVKSTAPSKFEWEIPCHVESENPEKWGQRQEMEIWYEGQTPLILDIYDPNQVFLGSCTLGGTFVKPVNDFPQPIILIHHNFDDEAKENHIDVFIDDRYQKLVTGKYRFELKLPANLTNENVDYHAWVEENKEYPSKFDLQYQVQLYTISSIANGKLPITVGAYYPDVEEKPIWYASSSGPSRNMNALDKPTISAPGDDISAARSHHYSLGDRTSKSGTSQAAPHVSGLIALMFQTARDRRNPPKELDISQIRQILIDTADRNPPQGGNGLHDLRYGYGRVNCIRALDKVLA